MQREGTVMVGTYQTVCYSCGEEHVSKDYLEANDFFGSHFDRNHEVLLVNLEAGDCFGEEATTSLIEAPARRRPSSPLPRSKRM